MGGGGSSLGGNDSVFTLATLDGGSGGSGIVLVSYPIPSAPRDIIVTPRNSGLTLSWTAGADGGVSITNYEYQIAPAGGAPSVWTAFSPAVTGTSATIAGLVNETLYTVKLRAVSRNGQGLESAEVSGTPDGISPSLISSNPSDDDVDINIATTLTLTFSEPVTANTGDITVVDTSTGTNFEVIDVTSSAVTISEAVVSVTFSSDFASSTSYHVLVAGDAFRDGAGNGSAALSDPQVLNFRTAEAGAATLTLSNAPTIVNSQAAFNVTATFSADVSGFASDDVSVVNAAVDIFGGPAVYTIRVNPTGVGDILLGVPANAATTTSGGVGNTVSNTVSVTYDATPPVVSFVDPPSGVYSDDPFDLAVTFSEVVTGFDASDVSVTNASVAVAGSGTTYTLTVTPDGSSGDVSIRVNAGAAQDVATNDSAASSELSLAYSTAAPNVVSTSPADDATNVGLTASISITFDKEVIAGTGSIELRRLNDNAAIASFNVLSSAVSFSGSTVTIQPTSPMPQSADLYIYIAAGAITDPVGTQAVEYDGITTANFSTAAGEVTIEATTSGVESLDPLPPAEFTVTLSDTASGNVTVNYSVSTSAANAATAGLDFGPLPGFVVIPDGQTTATIFVTVLDDNIFEGTESVTINIDSVTGSFGIGTSSASIDITDDEMTPVITIAGVVDGNEGTTSGRFTVSMTAENTADTVVSYSVGGSASSGFDYNALSGSVTIPAGSTSADIDVIIVDDDSPEPDETLSVTLTGVTGDSGVLGAANSATINVWSDDNFQLAFSTSTLTLTEGGASETIGVSLDGRPGAQVSIPVTVFSGSGVTLVTSSVTFGPEDAAGTTKNFTIRPEEDDDLADNTVTIRFTNLPTGFAAGTPPQVTVTVNDNDTPSVTVVGGPLSIAEGENGTFTIALSNEPSGNVMVALASGDEGAVILSSSSLTFTSGDWNTAQTVTVTGVEDADLLDETVTVTIDPGGADYDSAADATLQVTVSDNDVPFVDISPAGPLAVGEGSTQTFTVALGTEPSGDVTVALASGDAGAVALSDSSLTFTSGNWNTAQTVTVTGVEDDNLVDETVTVTANPAGADYDSAVDATLQVTVSDDDTAAVIVVGGPLSITEGQNSTFTIALSNEPSGDITVALASGDAGAVALSDSSLTFTSGNWNTAQTVTVTGVEDDDLVDENVTATIDPSGADYDNAADATLQVTVSDDDTAAVIVVGGPLSITEGQNSTFTIALSNEPSGDVTVALASGDAGAVILSDSSLTFTSGNWNTAQTVTVTGVEDDDLVDETVTVTIDPAGAEYDSAVDATLQVTVNDDDTAAVVISPDSTLVLGEGSMQTFTVALSNEPSGDVTVALASDDEGAATLSTSSLTFTSGDWNTAQTVTVTGVEDDNSADETVTVTANPSEADYDNAADATLQVTVSDSDIASVLISPAGPLAVGEGSVQTFTVALGTEPSDDVTVALASDDEGVLTLSTSGLTFTSGDWNTAQTVTVTGVEDDNLVDETVTVTANPAGADYDSAADVILQISVSDDDMPSVTFVGGPLSITEGQSGTFAVALSNEPSGDVTVALASDDEGAATLSSSSLTFTSGDWNTVQTVTVTGVEDDNLVDETVTVTANPAGAEYDSATDATLQVTVSDDDTAAVVISPDSTLVLGEGSMQTFTVALSNEPSGDVTVALASDDEGVVTLSTSSLTFTSGDWNTAQTVTVTGVEDDDLVDEDVTITANPAGADYDSAADAILQVTVSDSDIASVLISPAGPLAVEEGSVQTFTVALGTEPSDDVTVTLTSSDERSVTLSTNSLTFTSGNWNTVQTVTVTGVEDDDLLDETVTITANPAGAEYDSAADATLQVTVSDNDVPFVDISPVDTLAVGERSAQTFTVALSNEPSGDVTVALASDDEGALTLSTSSLTFTSGNWNTAQTVTATGVEDDDLLDETVTITANPAGSEYDSAADAILQVTVNDDDTAAVVISPAGTLVVGEGSTQTFTVALSNEPSGDVTVALVSDNEGVVTLSTDSLTFTSGDWDTVQTVTVTGVDNENTGDSSANISLDPSGSEYDLVDPVFVSVTVGDDDFTVSPSDAGHAITSVQNSIVVGTSTTKAVASAGKSALLNIGGRAANSEDYGRLYVISSRDGRDGFSLVDWYTMGVVQASVDAELDGEGVFGYAMIGSELSKSANRVSGLLYGVESSSWEYARETDVRRTGLSIGYYVGRRMGGLFLTGSTVLTGTSNEFTSVSDATASANSTRAMVTASISGEQLFARGGSLSPFVNLLYASEETNAFTFSDDVQSEASEASVGKVSLGLEYRTPASLSYGRFVLRGEVGQVFGTEEIRLNGGTIYSPNEDPTGSITLGWLPNPSASSTMRVDLTFAELGNDETEEVRFEGTWDRHF